MSDWLKLFLFDYTTAIIQFCFLPKKEPHDKCIPLFRLCYKFTEKFYWCSKTVSSRSAREPLYSSSKALQVTHLTLHGLFTMAICTFCGIVILKVRCYLTFIPVQKHFKLLISPSMAFSQWLSVLFVGLSFSR